MDKGVGGFAGFVVKAELFSGIPEQLCKLPRLLGCKLFITVGYHHRRNAVVGGISPRKAEQVRSCHNVRLFFVFAQRCRQFFHRLNTGFRLFACNKERNLNRRHNRPDAFFQRLDSHPRRMNADFIRVRMRGAFVPYIAVYIVEHPL